MEREEERGREGERKREKFEGKEEGVIYIYSCLMNRESIFLYSEKIANLLSPYSATCNHQCNKHAVLCLREKKSLGYFMPAISYLQENRMTILE